MKSEELRQACNDAIAIVDPEFEPHVYLTLTRPRCPEGRNIRLLGRSGPLGEVLIVRDHSWHEIPETRQRFKGTPEFEVVAIFKAREVLACLERIGA